MLCVCCILDMTTVGSGWVYKYPHRQNRQVAELAGALFLAGGSGHFYCSPGPQCVFVWPLEARPQLVLGGVGGDSLGSGGATTARWGLKGDRKGACQPPGMAPKALTSCRPCHSPPPLSPARLPLSLQLTTISSFVAGRWCSGSFWGGQCVCLGAPRWLQHLASGAGFVFDPQAHLKLLLLKPPPSVFLAPLCRSWGPHLQFLGDGPGGLAPPPSQQELFAWDSRSIQPNNHPIQPPRLTDGFFSPAKFTCIWD